MGKKWEELNTKRYYEYINSIIKSRGQWAEIQHCSRHHIKLKCKGGLPKKLTSKQHENIIYLTHYEHAIAHKILAEDNINDYKVCCAFILTKKFCDTHNIALDTISEEVFNRLYSAAQARNGEENGMFGKTHSKESMDNMIKHRDFTTYHSNKFREKCRERNMLCKWYTDGSNETFSQVCPEGWHKGRKPGTNAGGKNAAAIKCYVYDIDKNLLNIYDCINEAGKANGLKDKEAKGHTGWDKGPYKGLYYIKESEVI